MRNPEFKNTPTSVRFSEEELTQLGALAIIDGTSISSVIKNAVLSYIDIRTTSLEFPDQVEVIRQNALQRVDQAIAVFDNKA